MMVRPLRQRIEMLERRIFFGMMSRLYPELDRIDDLDDRVRVAMISGLAEPWRWTRVSLAVLVVVFPNIAGFLAVTVAHRLGWSPSAGFAAYFLGAGVGVCIVLVVGYVATRRRVRRLHQEAMANLDYGICRQCGYDLRGTPGGLAAGCSECGWGRDMNKPKQQSGIQLDLAYVIDRNVLSPRSDFHQYLPDGFQTVLPDVLFREALANPMEKEPQQLVEWLKRHKKTIWIARWWWDVEATERDRHVVIDPTEIISTEMTEALRCAETIGWPEGPVPRDEYDDQRDTFISYCESCYEYMCANGEAFLRDTETHDQRSQFIQEPEIMPGLFTHAKSDYQGQGWILDNLSFPDQFAIARFQRMLVWFAIARARGETKKFDNNWDDLHYAFTASYVGRLVTEDKRLRLAVSAVFPHVELIPPWPSSP